MTDQNVLERIKQDVSAHPIFLYMKGSPNEPQCGFSAQVVHVLKSYGVKFGYFDVLSDGDVREGIKQFANWPTIPQLYVNGKFVGGCDITMELHRKGELAALLKSVESH